MLRVTNVKMRKTGIVGLMIGIIIFSLLGCKDSSNANGNDNNNNSTNPGLEIETIHFDPPKPLFEVIEGLESGSSIFTMKTVEPYGTAMQVVFTQDYDTAEPILQEYNQARVTRLNLVLESNERDMAQFANSQLADANKMVNALDAEKTNVEAGLAIEMDETLLIQQITVKKQRLTE
jgi:hypothetical protein